MLNGWAGWKPSEFIQVEDKLSKSLVSDFDRKKGKDPLNFVPSALEVEVFCGCGLHRADKSLGLVDVEIVEMREVDLRLGKLTDLNFVGPTKLSLVTRLHSNTKLPKTVGLSAIMPEKLEFYLVRGTRVVDLKLVDALALGFPEFIDVYLVGALVDPEERLTGVEVKEQVVLGAVGLLCSRLLDGVIDGALAYLLALGSARCLCGLFLFSFESGQLLCPHDLVFINDTLLLSKHQIDVVWRGRGALACPLPLLRTSRLLGFHGRKRELLFGYEIDLL